MDTSAKEVAANISELATFPEVAIQISDAIADENSEVEDISALVETDPALSAAILRIANSPIYSVGGTVESVKKAVVVVGFKELRDLSFGICATRTFQGVPNELISVEDFWKHSLYCAVASQQVANHGNICRGESLFTMGLLHDIGQLAMFNQYPGLSRDALSISLDENNGLMPYLSERKVFGFDHMDVGLELAKLWKFPQNLGAAIGRHHTPYDYSNTTEASVAVHAGNSIAVLAELDTEDFSEVPPIHSKAIEQLGLDESKMLQLGHSIRSEVGELLKVFLSE